MRRASAYRKVFEYWILHTDFNRAKASTHETCSWTLKAKAGLWAPSTPDGKGPRRRLERTESKGKSRSCYWIPVVAFVFFQAVVSHLLSFDPIRTQVLSGRGTVRCLRGCQPGHRRGPGANRPPDGSVKNPKCLGIGASTCDSSRNGFSR